MTKRKANREVIPLRLSGLEPAPAQVWGSVRLLPLLRATPLSDLRLGIRSYDTPAQGVHLGRGESYTSFLPHGLVVSWSDDGNPAATCETWLSASSERRVPHTSTLHRLVKREDRRRLRMLPMHVALEGLLSLHFGGPDIADRIWSGQGLSQRMEWGMPGWGLPHLNDALRRFEIHPGQCGVLVFVADALASALVVPDPADYLALHQALILDLYGGLLWQYGHLFREVPEWSLHLPTRNIASLADLDAAFERAKGEWALRSISLLANGLFSRDISTFHRYQAGPFRLCSFLTGTEPTAENHIGEAIHHRDGTLAYLKTFRLSRAALRRVHLLSTLASVDWDSTRAAQALGCTLQQLYRRLIKEGFGGLLTVRAREEAMRRRDRGR